MHSEISGAQLAIGFASRNEGAPWYAQGGLQAGGSRRRQAEEVLVDPTPMEKRTPYREALARN